MKRISSHGTFFAAVPLQPDGRGKDRGRVIQSSRIGKTIARLFRTCAVVCAAFVCAASSAAADPVGLQWPQPGGDGTPVYITYSYSNLLDGSFLLISPDELRAATEEALGVWAKYAPLHFIEQPDSGWPTSDVPYSADGQPQIRIGHHELADAAHGFYPGTDGLSGDVHLSTGVPWTIGEGHWNYLEALSHELGHALGLAHELDEAAIMNPSYPSHRFDGLGSAFLYPSDIRHLQAIYGVGVGSVQPLNPAPEPAASVLLATGLSAVAWTTRRRRMRAANSAATGGADPFREIGK